MGKRLLKNAETMKPQTGALPKGWTIARLSEVAEVRLGKTPARSQYTNQGVHRVVKFRDLSNGREQFSETKDAYVRNFPEALRSLSTLSLRAVRLLAPAHSGEQTAKKCAFVD